MGMFDILQTTHDNLLAWSCNHKLCTYLNGYLLEAPRQYVHNGLALGLDWTYYRFSSTCISLVCSGPHIILLFVPTILVTHVHPPLSTGQLNTSAQANNMATLHHIYTITHIYSTSHLYYYPFPFSYFFHSFGQAGWQDPCCLSQ